MSACSKDSENASDSGKNPDWERGRAIYATYADQKGDPALQAMCKLPQAEFQYDPEALLMDMPNADQDLEVLARHLSKPQAA